MAMMLRDFLVVFCVLIAQRSAALSLSLAASSVASQRMTQPRSVDVAATPDDNQNGSKIDGLASSLLGVNKTANMVWIPSWPRSGSTTFFHMVLAAASEADMIPKESMAFEDHGRARQLYVPEMPPSDAGCWVLAPSGCPGSKLDATHWKLDSFAGSHVTRAACEARRSSYNKQCNVTDSAVLFNPSRDYRANPIKRHFGLYEPCHQRYGTPKQFDAVAPELQGNCKLTMDRLFRCDFTGMEHLWGWDRPHSDITGVTPFGAAPPTFTKGLAQKSCARSDLIVYTTVHDFGRKVAEVIEMLKNHPQLKALVPLRDPRGIYASLKQLSSEPPGVSVLKQICDDMAGNADVKHGRLKRVPIERLVERPHTVMRKVYDFLGLDLGIAQERWLTKFKTTAFCNGTASASNKSNMCSDEPSEPLSKWKTLLTDYEKHAFETHPSCSAVADRYGYDIEPAAWWKHMAWRFEHF